MRVGLDATPLLGTRTGIGHYVAGLLHGLRELAAPPDVVLTAFTWRGISDLPRDLPAAPRRAPARALHALWRRADWPPVEALSGRIDVFHGTNYVLPPTRRAAGVLSVHDLTYERHADTVTDATLAYRVLVPRALRRGAVVLTLTEAVAGEVRDFYALPPERVMVARPGVDAAWLAAAPPSPPWLAARGLPPRYLLFVGNREPRKNLPVLLAALASLHRSDPATPPLVLVGPPGWGPELDASALPPGAVVTPGYLPHDELRAVVAGAAALVFPSRYEGFGLPPLEALACGTPVVASDLPVLREVLGPHAAYAPVGDVSGLAAAVAAVLAAGDGGAEARAARRAHASAYTWARCAGEAVSAYERALSF